MIFVLLVENTPPIPNEPIPLEIVDDGSKLATALKKELTQEWITRLNPIIEKTDDVVYYCNCLDRRRQNLHKYFKITFVKSPAINVPRYLSIRIGRYGRWQRLPEDEWLEYPTEFLKLFEYIRSEYFYDKTVDAWKDKYSVFNEEYWYSYFSTPEPLRPVSPLENWRLE